MVLLRSNSADSVASCQRSTGAAIRSFGGCSEFLIGEQRPAAAVVLSADLAAAAIAPASPIDAGVELSAANQASNQWMRVDIAAAIRNIHNAKKATIRQHYYPEGIYPHLHPFRCASVIAESVQADGAGRSPSPRRSPSSSGTASSSRWPPSCRGRSSRRTPRACHPPLGRCSLFIREVRTHSVTIPAEGTVSFAQRSPDPLTDVWHRLQAALDSHLLFFLVPT